MGCYYKSMKIKFSNEVRAALKEFSKVDRREYIEKAVAKQLAKDWAGLATASDPEQKESEPVSEKSRVTTWGPVEGTVPFSYSCSSGSGSGFVGDEWSDSDSDEDTYPYQEEWRMVRERQGRISFSNRDRIPPSEVLVRSPDSDAEQKEPEPLREASTLINPGSGSGYAGGGGCRFIHGTSASGFTHLGGGGGGIAAGSHVPAGYVYGSGTGGNASQSN